MIPDARATVQLLFLNTATASSLRPLQVQKKNKKTKSSAPANGSTGELNFQRHSKIALNRANINRARNSLQNGTIFHRPECLRRCFQTGGDGVWPLDRFFVVVVARYSIPKA